MISNKKKKPHDSDLYNTHLINCFVDFFKTYVIKRNIKLIDLTTNNSLHAVEHFDKGV